ncbi:MAG: DUF996 domain-containing protein [Nitrososphaerota archaeon]|jgi:uncharacterized membrane protein|nr:DUF996 domain-containing protein [Nitrososphaerota archaeon]
MSDTLIASKVLAAIGSILLCLSFIPIIGIIGIILMFSGIRGIAEHYRDGNMYRNAFTGTIFGAIGLSIMGINEFITYTTNISITDMINRILNIGQLFNQNAGIVDIQYHIFNNPYFIPFLVIVFIFNLLMAIYLKKAFQDIARRSGERLFNAAGTMMIIGAILTIAFFTGLVLIYIAFIIAAAAFCTIKTKQFTTTTATQQQHNNNTTTTMEAKYCPHCGAPVAPGTTFCTQCGKQI